MAKKVQQQYAPFKTTTPKLEAWFCNLTEPDEFSNKYDASVVMDDSPECQAMLKQLTDWQNEQLVKDGRDPEDTLLCLKPEKSKNETTEKWENPTGRYLLFFKSADKSKFTVVGPDKKPVSASKVSKGSTIRINGQAAFGYMKGDPYVTLYLNAVQWIEGGGGVGGVDAFDDESGGDEDAPFSDESVNHGDVELE